MTAIHNFNIFPYWHLLTADRAMCCPVRIHHGLVKRSDGKVLYFKLMRRGECLASSEVVVRHRI
jgi:hypothetical protein